MKLETFIIKAAKETGIDLIGFTDKYDKEKIREILLKRESEKGIVEFEPDDIESRLYPERLLESCNSIIALGISYNFKRQKRASHAESGIISKSAAGLDYHIIVREKAELLMNRIREKNDADYYIGVDTTPLLDREIAKNSGIGFYGKNCSIINSKKGSFIFLGYILTDLKLDSEVVQDESCGECDLCVKSCPTGAVIGDYTVNPLICISYLTQTKKKIPYELREKMGLKIYGCDTCQDVCPKNTKAEKKESEDLQDEKLTDRIDLLEFLSIDNKSFKEKYSDRALAWRGKNVLKRNALIAVGNTKSGIYSEKVKELLKDKSGIVREYALWALMNISLENAKEYFSANPSILDESLRIEYNSILEYMEGEIIC